METALYYTFSTIAQALAAAMALLAAIALYRLKGVDEESAGAVALIEGSIGGGIWLRRHSFVASWTKVMEEIAARETESSAEVRALAQKLRQLRTAAGRIRAALWTSLFGTALVMSLSVAALAYTPAIVADGGARQALNLGIAGLMLCLFNYFWLIWEAVRASKE